MEKASSGKREVQVSGNQLYALETTHINLFCSLSLFGGLPLHVQLKLLLDVGNQRGTF